MLTNKKIVMNYLTAFGSGDITTAMSYIDDAAVWRVDGSLLVPTVGVLQGKKRIGQWLAAFPSAFTPKKFTINTVVAEGEHVILTGIFRHQVHLSGLACENEQRLIDGSFALHFIVQHGKICRYQIFEDSLAIGKAFDADSVCQRQVLRINGVAYAYTDTIGSHANESKPVLLFAHGLFMTGSMFREQVQALSQQYRCVVLDMPGHGASSYDPAGWTFEHMTQDLVTFIQELGLDPVVFVGHSQGGMVGMRMAVTHPELLHGLILINTSARAEPLERLEYWQQLRKNLLSGNETERQAIYTDIQKKTSNERWLHNHKPEAAKERTEMLSNDRLGVALATDAAVLHRTDMVHKLTTISTPTLVISGELDEATTVDMGKEIAKGIANAQFVLIKGAKHHIPIETPQELLTEITAFINQGLSL